MNYRRANLANAKQTTATKVLRDNMEKFNACQTKEDIISLCKSLFTFAKIDTPWTRKFFYTLSQKRGYKDAMLYVGQCYLAGCGLGVGSKRDIYC